MSFCSKGNLFLKTKYITHEVFRNKGYLKISTVVPKPIIPKTIEEFAELKNMRSSYPPNSKMLTVSILGAPNAGKSTLTNTLLGWRVCSVSSKVHTTTRNTMAIMTQDSTQIVFLDTPGVVTLTEKRKHKLEVSMLVDPASSLKKADLIICLVDVSNIWTRHKLDANILRLLEENREKDSILVLNKIDAIKSKTGLLELTRLLTDGVVAGQSTHSVIRKPPPPPSLETILRRTEKSVSGGTLNDNFDEVTSKLSSKESNEEQRGWPHFQKVFMISALTGDGVSELKTSLLNGAKLGKWAAKSYAVTDQSPQEIATLAVREKFLNKLPKQLPYELKLKIDSWEVENEVLRICMVIGCPKKHYMKWVLGPAGKTISSVAQEATQDLTNTFRCEVVLKLIAEPMSSAK